MERILLLSMGFGTGHNATAKVLQTGYLERSGVTAEMVDLLRLIPKTFHPLLQNCYMGMLNRFPLFYHCLYDWTHQSKIIRSMSSGFIEKLGWTIHKKLNQIFDAFQPTRIVTTHPFVRLLLPDRWLELPSIGVVTDYELHPIWLVRVPDVLCLPKHIVSSEQMEKISWQTGAKLVETGIPIAPSFYQSVTEQEARRRLGLETTKPIALVMGGGTGLGPLEELVNEFRQLKRFHFVVITGNNPLLYQTLSNNLMEDHIQIESFRRDIPLWMSAADLLITKPGGVTISEAVAKRLPMFLFQAFPGQEEANQQYLLSHQVAVPIQPENVGDQLEEFFLTQLTQERLRRHFGKLVTPYALDDVVEETLRADLASVNVL